MGHIKPCDLCLLRSIVVGLEEKESGCAESPAKLVITPSPQGNSRNTASPIPHPPNPRRNYDEASVSPFTALNIPGMRTLASTSINLPDIATQTQTVCSHTCDAPCRCPSNRIPSQLPSEFLLKNFDKNSAYTHGNSGAVDYSTITSVGCSRLNNHYQGECVTDTLGCHQLCDRHKNSPRVQSEERSLAYGSNIGFMGSTSGPEFPINSCIQSRGLATIGALITMEQRDTPVTNIAGLSNVFPTPDTVQGHPLDWDLFAFNFLICDQGVTGTSTEASSIERHESARNTTPLETGSDICLTSGNIENGETATEEEEEEEEEEEVLRLLGMRPFENGGSVTSTME